jgi:hypothetical protein
MRLDFKNQSVPMSMQMGIFSISPQKKINFRHTGWLGMMHCFGSSEHNWNWEMKMMPVA